jgi:hypothetical protein
MPNTEQAQETTLARAAEAMARVRAEIDQLWRDSMMQSEVSNAETLVAVSHLIRSAHHVLDQSRCIG